jgi:hypothetical protein
MSGRSEKPDHGTSPAACLCEDELGVFSMTNKSGKNGRKPLTTRHRALIEELSKGQSAKDAAIVAGYAPKCARQQAYHAINRIKRNMPELLDEAGITDRALID